MKRSPTGHPTRKNILPCYLFVYGCSLNIHAYAPLCKYVQCVKLDIVEWVASFVSMIFIHCALVSSYKISVFLSHFIFTLCNNVCDFSIQLTNSQTQRTFKESATIRKYADVSSLPDWSILTIVSAEFIYENDIWAKATSLPTLDRITPKWSKHPKTVFM